MKTLPILLSAILISGCASKTATDSATDSAQKTLETLKDKKKHLESVLPEQCLTDEVMTQFRFIDTDILSLQSQIDTINLSCRAEVSAEKANTTRWQAYFLIMALLVAGLGYIVLKKR